jgi:hypothetical protein
MDGYHLRRQEEKVDELRSALYTSGPRSGPVGHLVSVDEQ